MTMQNIADTGLSLSQLDADPAWLQAEEALSANPTVLYVDDEPAALRAMSRCLRDVEVQLLVAANAEEAMEWVMSRAMEIDAVILDYAMPEQSGLELLRSLRFFIPDLPAMVLTGRVDDEIFYEALADDCDGFMEKPYEPSALRAMLQAMLSVRYRKQRQHRHHKFGSMCQAQLDAMGLA